MFLVQLAWPQTFGQLQNHHWPNRGVESTALTGRVAEMRERTRILGLMLWLRLGDIFGGDGRSQSSFIRTACIYLLAAVLEPSRLRIAQLLQYSVHAKISSHPRAIGSAVGSEASTRYY